jgi:hypothetical protein
MKRVLALISITKVTELWSRIKIRIAAPATIVYDRTYIFLHVYNSNFELPIRFLLTITIERRLAV